MCSVCYGIGNCPVCGDDDEPTDEELLDLELNAADDYNQTIIDNQF